MKLKQLLTKTLLAVALLGVGGSAWGAAGDITTLFSIDFSNELVQGTSAGTNIWNYTCAGSTGTLAMSGYRSSGTACNPSISGNGTLYFGCVGTASYTPSAGAKDSIQIEFDFAQGELTNKSVYFRTYDGDTKVGDYE